MREAYRAFFAAGRVTCPSLALGLGRELLVRFGALQTEFHHALLMLEVEGRVLLHELHRICIRLLVTLELLPGVGLAHVVLERLDQPLDRGVYGLHTLEDLDQLLDLLAHRDFAARWRERIEILERLLGRRHGLAQRRGIRLLERRLEACHFDEAAPVAAGALETALAAASGAGAPLLVLAYLEASAAATEHANQEPGAATARAEHLLERIGERPGPTTGAARNLALLGALALDAEGRVLAEPIAGRALRLART